MGKERCPSRKRLAAYVELSLRVKEAIEINAHLQECESCKQIVQSNPLWQQAAQKGLIQGLNALKEIAQES